MPSRRSTESSASTTRIRASSSFCRELDVDAECRGKRVRERSRISPSERAALDRARRELGLGDEAERGAAGHERAEIGAVEARGEDHLRRSLELGTVARRPRSRRSPAAAGRRSPDRGCAPSLPRRHRRRSPASATTTKPARSSSCRAAARKAPLSSTMSTRRSMGGSCQPGLATAVWPARLFRAVAWRVSRLMSAVRARRSLTPELSADVGARSGRRRAPLAPDRDRHRLQPRCCAALGAAAIERGELRDRQHRARRLHDRGRRLVRLGGPRRLVAAVPSGGRARS